jgi:DNA-binding response OmpR family regulator
MHKILVADDEPDILETVKNRLVRDGYFVLTAKNGQEALDLAFSEEPPDVIVLDIMMPNKNGFEVLKELRSREGSKWQPVIILSSKNDFLNIRKGYDLEADYYIAKPFVFSQLIKGIETMISLLPLRGKG